MSTILAVDDDPALLRTLQINLRARNYAVTIARDGRTALQVAADEGPDLIVLDLGLPDMDGIDVLRELRRISPTPIVVLSARQQSDDIVEALDLGANDYVTKPFSIDELLARIRSALRDSTKPAAQRIVETGSLHIDFGQHHAARDGATVHLTPTEWKLLEVLTRQPGALIKQVELLREVWGPAYGRETNYLRVYMAHLRRKLEPDPSRPRHLITEPAAGYRFMV